MLLQWRRKATSSTTKRKNDMSEGVLKRNVDHPVRAKMQRLPQIPFSQMKYRDCWELKVEEGQFTNRIAAVRSSYKRWRDANEEDQREFSIGKSKDQENTIAVYCYSDKSQESESSQLTGVSNEADEQVQLTGTDSRGVIGEQLHQG
jgi:hypothetical protein